MLGQQTRGPRNTLPRSAILVLFDPAIALDIRNSGVKDVVVLTGPLVSDTQLALIEERVALLGTVYFVTDRSAAAQQIMLDVFRRLGPRRAIRWIQLHDRGVDVKLLVGQLPYSMVAV